MLEEGWQTERDKRRGVGGGSAVMVYFVVFFFFGKSIRNSLCLKLTCRTSVINASMLFSASSQVHFYG